MPDTPTMEAPVKRKRGRPRKSAPAAVTADAHDRKLDHFATTRDEREIEWWESDQTLSPLHVPDSIKKSYPDRRFHWSSEKKWDRNGKNYHGWQVYTDAEHPNGIKRGNDTFLTWMPEEKASRYNHYVAESSRDRVRNQQASELEKKARASELDGFSEVKGGINIGARPTTGMLVNGKFIPAGRGQRGYSLDELKEAHIKTKEQRAKGRKYFT